MVFEHHKYAIPLSKHMLYVFYSPLLIVDSILTWRWPSSAETCRHRRTNKLRYSDSCVLTDLPTLISIKHNRDDKPEDSIISSTNFNAQFNKNIYVTLLSSTCFGPRRAHPQEEQLHKHSIWYPRSPNRLYTTPVESRLQSALNRCSVVLSSHLRLGLPNTVGDR